MEGTDQEELESLSEGSFIEIQLSHVLVVPGLLAQLLCSARKKGWCVSFWNGEGDEHPHDCGEDKLDPVQPSPTKIVAQEATDQRSDGRTDKRRCGKCCHGNSTLFGPPQICQCTADQSHGRAEGDTINGASDEQSGNVLRNSARDDEDDGHEQSRSIDDPTADNLTQRSKDHGTCNNKSLVHSPPLALALENQS